MSKVNTQQIRDGIHRARIGHPLSDKGDRPDNQPELARQMLESRTKVASETGFMMKFGERSHRAVTVYDAYDLGGQGYPVSENALESLPAYIRATLERDGVVQILT